MQIYILSLSKMLPTKMKSMEQRICTQFYNECRKGSWPGDDQLKSTGKNLNWPDRIQPIASSPLMAQFLSASALTAVHFACFFRRAVYSRREPTRGNFTRLALCDKCRAMCVSSVISTLEFRWLLMGKKRTCCRVTALSVVTVYFYIDWGKGQLNRK